MKRKINEENYNEQIEIGVAQDKFQAKAIVNMLRKEGIDAYSEGNSVFILVERDRNDPHYVDDIKQYAIEKFNEFCGDGKQPMKLACSKRKTIKLTESKLKSLIKESIEEVLDTMNVNANSMFIKDSMQSEFKFNTQDVVLSRNGYTYKIIAQVNFENGNSYNLEFVFGRKHISRVTGYSNNENNSPINIRDKKSCKILTDIYYWTLDDEAYCFERD